LINLLIADPVVANASQADLLARCTLTSNRNGLGFLSRLPVFCSSPMARTKEVT
jgi:hypothetical protein